MIKALVIDDELNCCDALAAMLKKRFSDVVEVAACCLNAHEGIAAIQAHNPQLVFLDVEMPLLNGFDMLRELPEVNFEIIFTTAFEQYAIRAIKLNAIDYLLKPFSISELSEALDKCLQRIEKNESAQGKVNNCLLYTSPSPRD